MQVQILGSNCNKMLHPGKFSEFSLTLCLPSCETRCSGVTSSEVHFVIFGEGEGAKVKSEVEVLHNKFKFSRVGGR